MNKKKVTIVLDAGDAYILGARLMGEATEARLVHRRTLRAFEPSSPVAQHSKLRMQDARRVARAFAHCEPQA